jgi:hypothetical protein
MVDSKKPIFQSIDESIADLVIEDLHDDSPLN